VCPAPEALTEVPPPTDEPEPAATTARTLPTGLPLHVTEVMRDDGMAVAEEGPAEVFVMLHGYGGASFTWRYWAPALAARGRLLLVDMKGFGAAPKPDDGAYGPVDLAALVADLIRVLDLTRVTLIGHSLGGSVALLTSFSLPADDRDRIARLVLIGAPAYRQRLPPFAHLARLPRASAALLRLVGERRVVRLVIRSIVFDRDSATEAMVDAYAAPLSTRDGVRAALDAGRMIVPDEIDELSRRFADLDLPVLLLWGDNDRVVPLSIGERLAAELPNARLVVLERCGHLPPEERPEDSLALVTSFLDDTL
jgi:pimeloyl-ACP methyl ester carboxylesterase